MARLDPVGACSRSYRHDRITYPTTGRLPATKAYVSFKGRLWKVPKAFCGERLAIRPLDRDGHYGAFFGAHHIATINLTNKQSVSDVSEQVSAMSPG